MALFNIRLEDDLVKEQVENGTLNVDDVTFMNHRPEPIMYPVGGVYFGALIASLIPLAQRKGLTLSPYARLAFSPPVCLGTGAYVGHLRAQRAAQRDLASLKNPEGYKYALLEIHKAQARKTGDELVYWNWTYGWMVAKRGSAEKTFDTEEDAQAQVQSARWEEPPEDTQQEREVLSRPKAPVPAAPRSDTPSSSQQKSPTRWDEIRRERAMGQPTAWDLLRQKHERERMSSAKQPANDAPAPPSNSSTGPSDGNGPNSSDEEEDEQAKFDALLEAERQLSAETVDKLPKRWS